MFSVRCEKENTELYMINLIAVLYTIASIVLPVAGIVWVWTLAATALKVAATAGIVYVVTDNLLTNYYENNEQYVDKQ